MAGAAGGGVAPAGGRRPCAPQPWRLLLSLPAPPPLLPDKGRFNQVGREGGRARAWEGRGKEPAHSPPPASGCPCAPAPDPARRSLVPPSPPHPSPTLKSTSPPASCARRGPSQGAAACCARLHGPGPEVVGCRGERAVPFLVPFLVPVKVGGWSPERSFQRWIPAKLRRLTSACDLLSPPFSCSVSLFSPFPHSEGQKDKRNLPQTKAFGIVVSAPSETAPKPLNAASAM